MIGESLAIIIIIWSITVMCFVIGSFLALPLIWFHIGYVSRKLSRMIELMEGYREED